MVTCLHIIRLHSTWQLIQAELLNINPNLLWYYGYWTVSSTRLSSRGQIADLPLYQGPSIPIKSSSGNHFPQTMQHQVNTIIAFGPSGLRRSLEIVVCCFTLISVYQGWIKHFPQTHLESKSRKLSSNFVLTGFFLFLWLQQEKPGHEQLQNIKFLYFVICKAINSCMFLLHYSIALSFMI